MDGIYEQSLQAPNQPPDNSSRRMNRPPGRGRGRGQASGSAQFRPSSVAPEASRPRRNDTSDQHGTSRGSRRGRGRGDGQAHNRVVNGRQFGGRLTQPDTAASPSTLQANAPSFVPGQTSSSTQDHPHTTKGPKRRPSKSQAPDLPNRIHEDIDNGQYECAICTMAVQRKAKVWACHTCWTVFHLSCIRSWSTSQAATAAGRFTADGLPPTWRCPGCNLPQTDQSPNYTCWCGKEHEPRAPAGTPPHSCGQSCARPREGAKACPHPCDQQCHAGPCPPCSQMGPTNPCFCGKHEVTKRCSDTDYTHGWSCGEVCGEVLECGEHVHEELCHEGLCGTCKAVVPARCYCGSAETYVLCSDRGEQMESTRIRVSDGGGTEVDQWIGSFDCRKTCGRPFDCGVPDHFCRKSCHAQDAEAPHCPRSPDVVTHCACGKTALGDLLDEPRTACTDHIPKCNSPCGKSLPCGHACNKVCHTGNCSPCMQTVMVRCRCGRTESKSICHQGQQESPQCTRVCRTTLNCGRHACDERCCTGEKKAMERQAVKKKPRAMDIVTGVVRSNVVDGTDLNFEPEHICTRECGNLLKCGIHHCKDLCHKGPCSSCKEAVFEDVSCHCGRTVLLAPLPCGTKPPPCRAQCERPRQCGHSQVLHNCHPDHEACPKCPYLVAKLCMCGKHTIQNQPCWLKDVRCSKICGKLLRCGSHYCRSGCHRPGNCEDANGQCQQRCGKPKKICGHPDEDACHSPFECKEDKPCKSKIYITCACQAQKQEMRCNASKASEGNLGKTLSCNEECARLERNRKLALALNIDQATHTDDHVPYSAETLKLFAENVKFAQTQEREFRVFAASEDEKRLRFKPMKSHERAFIHALADDFGLDSESMDPEPVRHVMVWKTPRFVSAPNKTLAEALRIRKAQLSATASANVSDNESATTAKKQKNTDPYNAYVITHPRFGLTVEDLRASLTKMLPQSSSLISDIEFLPSEEIILKAKSSPLNPVELQRTLVNLKTAVSAAIYGKGYGNVQLCTTDDSLNILRREFDTPAPSGWAKVAAKRAIPSRTHVPSSSLPTPKNQFAALMGERVTFAKKKAEKAASPKKKQVEEPVADDWEQAETAEEERERETAGESGVESSGEGGEQADYEVVGESGGEESKAEEKLDVLEKVVAEDEGDAEKAEEASGVDEEEAANKAHAGTQLEAAIETK